MLLTQKNGLYSESPAESAINLTLMQKIDRTFTGWPFLGVRQMCRYLVSLGCSASKKRILRLMGRMAVYQKPKTSVPNSEHISFAFTTNFHNKRIRIPMTGQHVHRTAWLSPKGYGLSPCLNWKSRSDTERFLSKPIWISRWWLTTPSRQYVFWKSNPPQGFR